MASYEDNMKYFEQKDFKRLLELLQKTEFPIHVNGWSCLWKDAIEIIRFSSKDSDKITHKIYLEMKKDNKGVYNLRWGSSYSHQYKVRCTDEMFEQIKAVLIVRDPRVAYFRTDSSDLRNYVLTKYNPTYRTLNTEQCTDYKGLHGKFVMYFSENSSPSVIELRALIIEQFFVLTDGARACYMDKDLMKSYLDLLDSRIHQRDQK